MLISRPKPLVGTSLRKEDALSVTTGPGSPPRRPIGLAAAMVAVVALLNVGFGLTLNAAPADEELNGWCRSWFALATTRFEEVITEAASV